MLQMRFAENLIHMFAEIECVYEEICCIIISDDSLSAKIKRLENLYESLGTVSDMLDNILYERLGFSCEDIMEVLIDEDNRKSCQKHMLIY